MPELPEVETIIRGLNALINGKKIQSVWIGYKKVIGGESSGSFEKKVRGAKIVRVIRRGKNILIQLYPAGTIWVHLRMTGQLLFRDKCDGNSTENTHARCVFCFTDGSRLLFLDIRKFGRIRYIAETAEKIAGKPGNYGLGSLGPEPLSPSFSQSAFRKILGQKNKTVKAIIMDQGLIAGIGNIYASEILFDAKVSPLKKASALNSDEIKRVYGSVRKILRKAIKYRGTSVSDFRDAQGKKGEFQRMLRVYKQTGKRCARCGNMITKLRQEQRSTFYCASCQKSGVKP